MFYIGCHLSSAKGFLAMGKDAEKIGATTFQFFTRNPRGGVQSRSTMRISRHFKIEGRAGDQGHWWPMLL